MTRVFVSYSHDSEQHKARVLALANRLRNEGVDAWCDRFVESPSDGWPRWTEQQVRDADFVLLVYTATLFRRWEGREAPGVGHGSRWEADAIVQTLYDAGGRNDKFIPVFFGDEPDEHIPPRLRGVTRYRLDRGYEDLYRRLTGQPAVIPGPLGPIRRLAPLPALKVHSVELSPAEMPPQVNPLTPVLPSSAFHSALASQMEQLREKRRKRLRAGKSVAKLDKQLLELKRRFRDGPELQPGDCLGHRFRLGKIIGRGGFATVWQATDEEQDHQHERIVAAKVLHGQYNADLSKQQRFYRGAEKMAGLHHQGIVRIVQQAQEDSGYHFYVMEYLPGGDLAHAVRAGRLSRDAAIALIVNVGEALQHAHEHSLVHRDVKPENILLDEAGSPHLTDFDLVRAEDSTGGTRTGAMGSYVYAAPEALKDASRVDARVDIYSLAMTAVFALCGGNLPHSDVVYSRTTFFERLQCPAVLKSVLLRALSVEPAERYASMADFCTVLRNVVPRLSVPTAPPPVRPLAPSPPSQLSSRAAPDDWFAAGPENDLDSLEDDFQIARGKRLRRWFSLATAVGASALLLVCGLLAYLFWGGERTPVPVAPVIPDPVPDIRSDLSTALALRDVVSRDQVNRRSKELAIPSDLSTSLARRDLANQDIARPDTIAAHARDAAPAPPAPAPDGPQPDWAFVPGGQVTLFPEGKKSTSGKAIVADFQVTNGPVTVAQYLWCVKQSKCSAPHWADDKCSVKETTGWSQRKLNTVEIPRPDAATPVSCVDWKQAHAYCDFVQGALLSEAQWQRAMAERRQPTSDQAGDHQVEWTQDCWHSDLSKLPNDGSAWIRDCDDEKRVIREGIKRLKSLADSNASDTVFRCARPPKPPGELDSRTGVRWVTLDGGTFAMGSNSGEDDEKPVHQVKVATFQIAQTETTAGQYRRCVKAGTCTEHDLTGVRWPGKEFAESPQCNWKYSDREDHPLNCVDWTQAKTFCRWAAGALATEAQWEYAARSGGKERTFPWSNASATCDRAVMDDGGVNGCGQDRTWAVCRKPAGNTSQGLCDMAGNVWEWVQDTYHESYQDAPADGSDWEDLNPSFRVYRGGGWRHGQFSLRATNRVRYAPTFRFLDLGWRCVRSVPK